MWTCRYNGSLYPSAIAVDARDNVFVTGSSVNGSDYDFVTINRRGHKITVSLRDDDYQVIKLKASAPAFLTALPFPEGDWVLKGL